MASQKREGIEMFAEHVPPPLPAAIKDVSNNDHYKPKDDLVDNWTVIVEKDEHDLFVLRFAYQMRVDVDDEDSWIKLKNWTVECAVAQGDYVVIDLEKKKTIELHSFCTSYTTLSTKTSVRLVARPQRV